MGAHLRKPHRDGLRRPRRRGQGRRDQADHGIPQPARRPHRRPAAPDRARARAMVFPALRQHLPAAGELVLFDRSWYNRAGVEHVLGFCTPEEHRRFLHQCPIFERLLVEDGTLLLKYWFSVSDEEQERRFRSRIDDPMRRWKLSTMDLESRTRWVDFSRAKDEMFVHTDIPEAPWYVVEGDDKRRARLNCIAHILSMLPYQDVSEPRIKLPPRPPDPGYERPRALPLPLRPRSRSEPRPRSVRNHAQPWRRVPRQRPPTFANWLAAGPGWLEVAVHRHQRGHGRPRERASRVRLRARPAPTLGRVGQACAARPSGSRRVNRR